MWTHISQACGFAQEGGKVQGVDPGQGQGQMKAELAPGRGSRARRQEAGEGVQEARRIGWKWGGGLPLQPAEQICVMKRACH